MTKAETGRRRQSGFGGKPHKEISILRDNRKRETKNLWNTKSYPRKWEW